MIRVEVKYECQWESVLGRNAKIYSDGSLRIDTPEGKLIVAPHRWRKVL